MDSRSEHRVTRHPDKECRNGIFDKVPVQIEFVLFVIGGGGWESRRNNRLEQSVLLSGG
jgi:hypothetical protein